MAESLALPCTVQPGAVLPVYKTAGAAGADVCARLSEPLVIAPHARALVPTGLAFAIPVGYEIQVRARSGLAVQHGITVLNGPGTIDSDFRGEVQVILLNTGDEPFVVHDGDRIAQIVVAPVVRATFIHEEQLSETERGSGGFGSTGVRT